MNTATANQTPEFATAFTMTDMAHDHCEPCRDQAIKAAGMARVTGSTACHASDGDHFADVTRVLVVPA